MDIKDHYSQGFIESDFKSWLSDVGCRLPYFVKCNFVGNVLIEYTKILARHMFLLKWYATQPR